jgi:hypothetical protein
MLLKQQPTLKVSSMIKLNSVCIYLRANLAQRTIAELPRVKRKKQQNTANKIKTNNNNKIWYITELARYIIFHLL